MECRNPEQMLDWCYTVSQDMRVSIYESLTQEMRYKIAGLDK